MSVLSVRGLRAGVGGREILTGIDLDVGSGEVHAVMGPNGSGKSTLAHVLMGRPTYQVLDGSVTLDGVDVLALPTWQRARAGLFLAMQDPIEVPGVLAETALAAALEAGEDGAGAVRARLEEEAGMVGLDLRFLDRAINVDLSGGERKRYEAAQGAVLGRDFAVLDELDSGLDVDGLRQVARRIQRATDEDGLGVLAITHYRRLLRELEPDMVHVIVGGRIVATGGPELAERVERDGYAAFGDDGAAAVG